jgi:hypothetical protein
MPARPIIKIDELERLAGLHCTQEEAAHYFRVSVTAVEKALRKPDFRQAWERGQAAGKISLRRSQFRLAEAGNATMNIWLGKQLLGQRNIIEQQITGPDGGPIKTEDVTPIELLRSRLAGVASRIGEGDDTPKPDA